MSEKKKEDFDEDLFETRLEALKDTQDGIQQMSKWCLENRTQHKKIVQCWLNVFKRTRVEQRLILFYVANDVIQYSKRKNYEFVESWATALQRATTMVRDERVKNKVSRIFSIWSERGIYSEDYVSDLQGLLNINPPKKPVVETVELLSDEFSNTKLIAQIRECVQNAEATDKSLRKVPKLPHSDAEALKLQLKDKSHTEDVEKDLDRYITYMKAYYKNLQTELKTRKTSLNELAKARKFYQGQMGEVKVVAAAYKNFGLRIRVLQKKLNDITPKLPSPMPSPDINAPSPEPDTDLQLPDDQLSMPTSFLKNSLNGYTSYLDGNLPFDINDFKSDEHGSSSSSRLSSQQPIEVIGARSDEESFNSSTNTVDYYKPTPLNAYSANNSISIPGLNTSMQSVGQPEYTSLARSTSQYGSLQPPPNPPVFDSNSYSALMSAYSTESDYHSGNANMNNSNNNSMMQNPSHIPPPPMPPAPLTGPMVNTMRGGGGGGTPTPNTWNMNMPWTTHNTPSNTTASNAYNQNVNIIETPISPVTAAPIEYTQSNERLTQTNDVDHRQMHLQPFSLGAKLGLNKDKSRQLDIDHRNLISLTGSPRTNDHEKKSWAAGDVDYRATGGHTLKTIDTIPMPSANSSVKTNNNNSSKSSATSPGPLMPPPPPATQNVKQLEEIDPNTTTENDDSGAGYDPTDMVIDMDMSDEDLDDILREVEGQTQQQSTGETQNVESSGVGAESIEVDPATAHLQTSNENNLSTGHMKPALLETPPEYTAALTNIWDPTQMMNMPSYTASSPTGAPLPPQRMPFQTGQQQQQYPPYMRPNGPNNVRGRGWSPRAPHTPYRGGNQIRPMRGGGRGGRGGGSYSPFGGGNPFHSRGGGNFRGRRGAGGGSNDAWI